MKRVHVGLACASLVVGFAVQSCATTVSLGPGLDEAGAGDSGPAWGGFTPPPVDGSAASDADAAPFETLKQCVGTQCTWPRATCDDGSVARCNVDLLSDNDNCGACGHKCETYLPLQIGTQCSGGKCRPFCMSAELRDCNGLVDDGCETSIANDPNNCGSCGNKCADGVPCIEGVCGCEAGRTVCNGRCVDLLGDNGNCGACGTVCPWNPRLCEPKNLPPNTATGCKNGQCGQLGCAFGYRDCNGDMQLGCDSVDGCETFVLEDLNNCGACGNKCAPGQYCRAVFGGSTPECVCGPGETACGNFDDPEEAVTCVDLANDPNNCGGCNHACPAAPNAKAVCRSGVCGLECPANRADCNGSWADGCEIDLLSNMKNCGACGNACDTDAGQPCINGSCLMVECDAGEGPH